MLLLSTAMRDFASCYNEHAVKVSDSSCSGSGNASSAKDPSVQRSVTCFYRTKLSTQKEFLIRVTWSKSLMGQGFSISVEDHSNPSSHQHPPHKPGGATNSLLLRKRKGSRSYVGAGDSLVEVCWDISSARYETGGPEPVGGFYVAVVVDAELGLRIGDMSIAHAINNKLQGNITGTPAAEFSMISRREQVVGSALYSTKTRFGDGGREHEVQIQCRGEGRDAAKDSELCVCVDRKKVVHVRRLRWNFRGHQTIFVDGQPVDMMWDVHDWWFSDASGSGCAAFMFRTRSALESRLWLEEEVLHKEQQPGKSGFSLLIHAFRSPYGSEH